MTKITVDEWQAEIARIKAEAPVLDGGMTIPELAAQLQRGETYTRRLIARGVAEGRYVRGRGYRKAVDGRNRPVIVYRIQKASK